VCVEQVHGVDVFRASAGNGGLTEVRADALVTDRPGVVLVVRTADCAPVLVAGSRAVAAIHAGWRGLAAGVVAAALDALRALDPGPFTAAVGPCIGPAAFEVGDEVVGRLGPFAVVSGRSTRGRPMVDLAAGCVAALAAGGVHAVDAVGVCTVRDAGWWSHRRDGPQAGRQGAAIAVAR
jgi:YfiH family protein